jgi:hypothetical protein
MAFFPGYIDAQKFGGGLIFGLNAAQIDGDDFYGFHKFGVNGGLNTSYDLSERWQINIEFLFSQRGAQSRLFRRKGETLKTLTLNYLELPVYLSVLDWKVDEGYHKIQGYAGLSYGRLFSVNDEMNIKGGNSEDFAKNDIALILGGKLMFTKNLGTSFRYTRSMIKLLESDELRTGKLISYFLNLSFFYKIL